VKNHREIQIPKEVKNLYKKSSKEQKFRTNNSSIHLCNTSFHPTIWAS